jgi:cyclic beta-1,2-glucan synthetase
MIRRLVRGHAARRPPPTAEDVYAGPIRGELLGAERLAERARSLATEQRTITERRKRRLIERPARLLTRLAQTRHILSDARDRLADVAQRGADIGPAGDWFLDNYHVVREHALQVHESLPEGYFRELPLLTHGTLAEYPRVYDIAIALISHTEARIDLDNVDVFVAAFQEREELSLGELWAIPAMLRLGLLESVRRMTLRTLQRLDEIESADAWTRRIVGEAEAGPGPLRDALAAFVEAGHPLTPTFVSRLLQQLRATATAVPSLLGIEQWFAEEGVGPTEAATRAAERLALTSLVMANSIRSLRSIGPRDWSRFVEHQSAVHRALSEDPTGHYPRMTFATRDSYRHAVERIARHAPLTESEVAARAVAHARLHPHDTRRAHVGYWLVDRGVDAFETHLGYAAPLGVRASRRLRRHPDLVYGTGVSVGAVIALLLLRLLAGPTEGTIWLAISAVGFLLGFDLAVHAMTQAVTAFLPPRLLPRLDFARSGVPADCRTAVVVPTLFATLNEVEDALTGLEVQYLANRGAHLHYALLSDHADAATETLPTDAALLAAAVRGIAALNARYAPTTHDAFYLFHRARRWNPQQGVWMGWERKRGKLGEFNRFLRGGSPEAFSAVVGDVAVLREVRYVVTLDADSVLPPDQTLALVGTIAHPLNRAVFDPARSRIVEGYGILQPRVSVSLASAHRSRFAALHSGHPGVDPYTTAVSDVYQDLYGEGSYTGKGIYDVDAFETATHGRFPENVLLSHDLIEGNYARAGLVTDITVFDDYPARYLTFWRRRHRWIRGDWQLLRWIGPKLPGPQGLERNRLSFIARWKILDNLRRSTVELAQLLFLLAGWLWLPVDPLEWTLLGLLAIAAPWLITLVVAVGGPPRASSRRAYYQAVGRDAVISAQQFALAVIFLPQQAWLAADAIVRTLWRLLVSHRALLEWQPSAHVELDPHRALSREWQQMWPAALLPVMLLAYLAGRAFGPAGPAPAGSWALILPVALLTGLWAAAPLVAHEMSRPRRRRIAPLDVEDRATALEYARAHWAFFARFADASTAWLAPDNVQEDPYRVVAMRTSPTNIGLQLLATVTAHDLGLIPLEEMTQRLERAFATIARLPRCRGHLLNWYALPDLTVLDPGYVSTVDSGNLAGHLIALRQACRGLAEGAEFASPALAARLRALEAAVERLVHEMDFTFLYDEDTKLFRIGFNTATHQLDDSSYDLLASEARLASFVAIAKHDVGPEHWFHLGRTLTRAHGHAALVSWSGSMFEYLMPLLVMRAFPGTLLALTYEGAVGRQQRHGEDRGVPWGVSESAYHLRDRHLTYQYRAFGVPDLALQRGLARDLVVAPYASALALMVDPAESMRNLGALERLGALGDFGFYDALDWTRPPAGDPFALVRCHMAHHVGMTLVAIGNALLKQRWQQRFHADPLVRAASLLLDERVPRRLDFQEPQPALPTASASSEVPEGPVVREYRTADTPRPHVALLGHAPVTVMVTHAGGGYTRSGGLAVTRWRPDGTRDDTGQFCYVRDLGSGRVWSSGHQPTGAIADRYLASLATDRVTIERTDGAIDTCTEIVVAPEDGAEVRRVTVTNNSAVSREVELTSYGEIVLAPRAADRAHPAFGNLFVETEWHEWCHALTATRRPRSADEATVWCAHVADVGPHRVGAVTYESDRARFLGRGRSTRDPVALAPGATLSGTTGAVLDPIFAIRVRLQLAAGESGAVAFSTIVAASREELFARADRYHGAHAARRALDLAWTATRIELREMGVTAADAAACQDLASYILFPDSVTRAPSLGLARNDGWQQALWAHGISGDFPLVLATIDSAEGLASLQPLLTAHRYWRLRGVHVDLLIVTNEQQSYLEALRERITAILTTAGGAAVLDASGGVHLRNRGALGVADFDTIGAVARLTIACDGRTLARIVADVVRMTDVPETREAAWPAADGLPMPLAPAPLDPPLRFDNGIGGLADGDRYHIRVAGDRRPPAPWANVIANPRGGFVVSESGGGFMWAASSYFHRLTPWSNDPVTDPVGEALYLRDEETGEFWSATPAPVRHGIAYTVTHGFGESEFRHEHGGLAAVLTLGMAGEEPVKLSRLRLTNHGSRARHLSLTSYVEWTLGTLREQTQHRVRTRFDAATGGVLADNPFDPQFASWVSFSAMSAPVTSHTGDRREFIGRNDALASPAAMRRAALGARTGLGVDPCAALRAEVTLAPGESRTIVVLLGAAPDEARARALLTTYRDVGAAERAHAGSVAAWDERLGAITVRTPDPAFDALVNRWALYQTLACRMWARSATYQSSGAFGFRDQLQDAMALVHAEPGLARAHLLRAAARQFPEGNVQHWWHPESGRGVRTRFSDDLAWLPYVVEHYVRVTGDRAVLDEEVPFLAMRRLEPHEHEIYDLPHVSEERASLHEHCRRALAKACTVGAHGLPLIGTGDWNDGMSRVGKDGHGESVWLGWFLVTVLRAYAPLADARGGEADRSDARTYRAQADRYVAAVEESGWDGAWYRRAFFDDGTPLGTATALECRIDSVAQSWSVISGAGRPDRQRLAMQSLEEHLVDPDARLIRLLTPPFDEMPHDPGYIKGYVPGVRENGAQYTHAAIWAVLAAAMLGDGTRAMSWFTLLNPFTHTDTPEGVATYRVEPYAIAADVYTAPGAVGRGGWTWYTGSASWMYRVGIEALIGVQRTGDRLRLEPCVPPEWPSLTVSYRVGTSRYEIEVAWPGLLRTQGAIVTADGRLIPDGWIPLVDDGAVHVVRIVPSGTTPGEVM